MLLLLLSLYTSAVQGELICTKRRQSLVGACGDTISLPCNFSWEGFPFTNLELVWQMKKSGDTVVIHHEDIKNSPNLHQNSRFRNRTSVKDGWPQSRDITLTLSNITGTDRGAYTCEIFTLAPFSRKFCAEIKIDVHTDPVGLGLGISMTATVGTSVHLPCLSRPGCDSSTHSLQASWRFLKSGTALEAELVSSVHPLTDASHDRILLSENGTLSLQGLMTTDAGTYSCHLAGQGKVAEILLEVTDTVKPRYMVVQLLTILVIVILLFIAGVTFGLKRKWHKTPKQLTQSHEKVESTSTESHDQNNSTCQSIQPLLEDHNDRQIMEV